MSSETKPLLAIASALWPIPGRKAVVFSSAGYGLSVTAVTNVCDRLVVIGSVGPKVLAAEGRGTCGWRPFPRPRVTIYCDGGHCISGTCSKQSGTRSRGKERAHPGEGSLNDYGGLRSVLSSASTSVLFWARALRHGDFRPCLPRTRVGAGRILVRRPFECQKPNLEGE